MEDNKFKLIRQPYAITMAKHQLNVHEFRIMTRVIEALQPNMGYGKDRIAIQRTLIGDVILHLPTSSLLVEDSQNHSVVKRALKSLEEKVIHVRGKDSNGEYETNARLVMKSKYYLNNRMIEIQLDKDLVPEMLALANNYSQYLLDVAFNSSSIYVAKLYLFFSHWKDKTKKSVMTSELREWLMLGDKYEKPKDFRKRILDPAIKELKSRADVWFDIDRPIKLGKSIVGYVFKIYTKPNTLISQQSHTQNVRNSLKLVFDMGKYHINKLEHIISKPELSRHLQEKIHDLHHYILKNDRNIKNVKSYVVKSLLNEFDSKQPKENKLQNEFHEDISCADSPFE
jgi:plasmid replication initiation protein